MDIVKDFIKAILTAAVPRAFVPIDATGRHHEAQLIVVIGEWNAPAEGERLGAARFAVRSDAGQRPCRPARIGDVAVGNRLQLPIEPPRERDGIAIKA